MAHRTAAAGALALFAAGAHAGVEEAQSCLRERVWPGFEEGWGIRSISSATLDLGSAQSHQLTLFRGVAYRIEACGDGRVVDVDLLIYDQDDAILVRDAHVGPTPRIDFTPKSTGTYRLVVYQRDLNDPTSGPAAVALSVVYR